MEADQRSASSLTTRVYGSALNGRPVVEQDQGITSLASTSNTGREREIPNGSNGRKSPAFRSTELFELMESLILAQDERWRRA
jgi:hypothetical protein